MNAVDFIYFFFNFIFILNFIFNKTKYIFYRLGVFKVQKS